MGQTMGWIGRGPSGQVWQVRLSKQGRCQPSGGTEMMNHEGGSKDEPVAPLHSLGPQRNLQETLTTHCPGWSGGHAGPVGCPAGAGVLASWAWQVGAGKAQEGKKHPGDKMKKS